MTAVECIPAPPRPRRGTVLALVLLPLLLAMVAHWPAAPGAFLFDDIPSIEDNDAIQAGDWWDAAFGRQHSPIAGRPLVCAWFALDVALFGVDARAFRFENLLLHLANTALLLFAVRSALLAPNLRGRFAPARALRLAAAIATIWAVHPLGVDAVGYATQRTTLAMSFCLLLALRALQTAHATAHRGRWQLLAFVATAAGMACKEEMVAAPLLLLLYERAFLLPDWRAMLARVPFHALLAAAAWSLLLACIAAAPPNETVGYHTRPNASAFEWLLTQTGVVATYLRLSLWPADLRGYYDQGVVRDVATAAVPGAMLLALLAATIVLWRRRPWWGWLGALFFLQLAPTSSVLPIITEVVAERRAYLPMLAALVPAVLALDWLLRRLARRDQPIVFAAIVVAVATAAVAVTRARVAVYADPARWWEDNYRRNECTNGSFQAGMVLSNYGLVVRRQGDLDRALQLFRRAMDCAVTSPYDRMQYAMVLVAQGNREMAEPILRTVVQDAPELAEAHGNLATLLVDLHMRDPATAARSDDPRLLEACAQARAAVQLKPRRAAFANTLAWLLVQTGKPDEAEPLYRRAIALEPHRLQPYVNLTDLLLARGRQAEAARLWSDLLQQYPTDVELRVDIGAAMLDRNDKAAAQRILVDALRLDPQHARARQLLARAAIQRTGPEGR